MMDNKFKIRIKKTFWQVFLMVVYLVVSLVGTRTMHGVAFIVFVLITGKHVFNRYLMRAINNGYIKLLMILSIYILISALWADKSHMDTNVAEVILLGLTEEIYIFLYFYNMLMKEKWTIDTPLFIYLAFAMVVAVYILLLTPVDYWTASNLKVGSNVNLNRNIIGMLMAFASTICYYFSKKSKRKLFYYVIICVMGSICLFTGSRKGALILVGGIVGYMIFSERNVRFIRNLSIGIGLLVVIYILIMSNDTLYNKLGIRFQYLITSILSDDSTVESSLNTRAFYQSSAIILWKNRPIAGYGLDGFSSYMNKINYWHVAYSHCNYTEMLADYGIIGFLLYYVHRFYTLFYMRRLKYRRNQTISMLWICSFIMLIMEYGCVSYYALTLQLVYIISALALLQERKKSMKHI